VIVLPVGSQLYLHRIEEIAGPSWVQRSQKEAPGGVDDCRGAVRKAL